MIRNAVDRELPEQIGSYVVKPYSGLPIRSFVNGPVQTLRTAGRGVPRQSKLVNDLRAAILDAGLSNGMTISFHHSFREGDLLIGKVLETIRDLGIHGLCFAPSAVVNLNNCPLADYVQDGTIARIEASGIRGDLGDKLIRGETVLKEPAILRPHGARPRAIEAGELNIDVAFIGASAADDHGNCTGQIGPNACGSLGYSFSDAYNARYVIVVTESIKSEIRRR